MKLTLQMGSKYRLKINGILVIRFKKLGKENMKSTSHRESELGEKTAGSEEVGQPDVYRKSVRSRRDDK